MRVVAFIALFASCMVFGAAQAEVSGSSSSNRGSNYTGRLELSEEDSCSFMISIDPVLFRLHTLEGRYRIVRIKVANRTSKPVVLSGSADRIKVRLRDGRDVQAILNMQQEDAAVWDRLDVATRTALAYPKMIPKGDEGAAGHRLSEMSFFVFLPADVADPPVKFELVIASLKTSVEIELPAATAA